MLVHALQACHLWSLSASRSSTPLLWGCAVAAFCASGRLRIGHPAFLAHQRLYICTMAAAAPAPAAPYTAAATRLQAAGVGPPGFFEGAAVWSMDAGHPMIKSLKFMRFRATAGNTLASREELHGVALAFARLPGA